MRKLTIGLFLFLSAFVTTAFAQQEAQPNSKIYSFYLADSSYVLQNIEQSELNGIKCIKGTHVDMTWVRNRTIYLPIDKINNIVEYNSLEDYKNAVDTYNKKRID